MDCIWVLLIAGIAWGFGLLVGRRTRSGDSPGVPTGLHPKDHDEPLEDVAKSIDTPRHEESGIDEAKELRDIRRGLGT